MAADYFQEVLSELNIRIITDSAADVAAAYRDRIQTVPLLVSFGDEEYLDGVTLSRDDFYRKLESGNVTPKTGQATPPVFEEVFSEIEKAGDAAIVITVSAFLSGTYQSACLAAADHLNIRVVDSRSVTIGEGILAEYACRRVDEGAGLDELTSELEEKRNEICVLAMLDTLEYLKRGGRISKTAAFAGGMLNIKPVIMIKDGEVAILGKARGSKKANNFLNEQIGLFGLNYELPVLLGYAGVSDELLQRYVADSRALWEGKIDPLECAQIGTAVGTHAGPGAVAVAFFKKHL